MSIRMDSNFSTVANIREGMDLCADQNNSPFQVRQSYCLSEAGRVADGEL
jgi:hypothetical protein